MGKYCTMFPKIWYKNGLIVNFAKLCAIKYWKIYDKQTAFTSTFQVIFHSIYIFPWFWRVWRTNGPTDGQMDRHTLLKRCVDASKDNNTKFPWSKTQTKKADKLRSKIIWVPRRENPTKSPIPESIRLLASVTDGRTLWGADRQT